VDVFQLRAEVECNDVSGILNMATVVNPVAIFAISSVVKNQTEAASLRTFPEGDTVLDSIIICRIRIEIHNDVLFGSRHSLTSLTDAAHVEELERQRVANWRTAACACKQGSSSPRLEPLNRAIRVYLTNILDNHLKMTGRHVLCFFF